MNLSRDLYFGKESLAYMRESIAGYVYPFERGVRYGRCREVPVIREITHRYETCVGRGLVVAFDSKGKFVFDRRFFLYAL